MDDPVWKTLSIYCLCSFIGMMAMLALGQGDPSIVTRFMSTFFMISTIITGGASLTWLVMSDVRIGPSLSKEQRKQLRSAQQSLEYDRRMADIEDSRRELGERYERRTKEIEAALKEDEEPPKDASTTTPASVTTAEAQRIVDDAIWDAWCNTHITNNKYRKWFQE